MSRADDLRRRAEAEAAVLDLEDRLIELKDGGDPADLAAAKHALRAARAEHRGLRAADPAEAGTARPETVRAAAEVAEV
jgi:hypothetical protein